MKNRTIFLTLIISVFCLIANAQDTEFTNCTSIMVGKKASADGSVITSHTCDGFYRTWMRWEPAQDHEKGAMHKVYKGTMHTADPYDSRRVELVGEIPEVEHTYSYLNTAYPCLNEKQLAIGETTFSGPDTLVNKEGWFCIEELERIALQRCDNARDAIRVITELAEKYGYGDGGECITIADKNEVWLFEIMGAGPKKPGAVWAAQRVPDDEVCVSANIPRIIKLNRNDTDNFLCSDNVEKIAKKYGLWDGEGELIWYKAFSSSYSNGKNHREREYFIFNELAPSLNLQLDDVELPFSVKPEKPVSVTDVTRLFRSTYEGTDMDMTKNLKATDRNGDTIISPIANPWVGSWEQETWNIVKQGTIEFRRTVAVSWCSYSFVAQLRDWLPDEIGGVCWLSVENPGQSPRIPVFCGASKMPSCFDRCGHDRYDEETAIWRYRKANKLAQVQWGRTKQLMFNEILRYENKFQKDLPSLEKDVVRLLDEGKKDDVTRLLNNYTMEFEAATAESWKQLEHRFWRMFAGGF